MWSHPQVPAIHKGYVANLDLTKCVTGPGGHPLSGAGLDACNIVLLIMNSHKLDPASRRLRPRRRASGGRLVIKAAEVRTS